MQTWDFQSKFLAQARPALDLDSVLQDKHLHVREILWFELDG